MRSLIRSELLSLRGLRSTYVALAGLLVLTGGMTLADMGDLGKPTMDSAAELREPMVASAGIVAAVFVAILGAVRTGGEYRYGTVVQHLLAAPQRQRYLASRLVVYGILGGVVSAAVFAVGAALTLPFVHAEHLSLGLSGGHAARLLGEVVLSGALLSVIGAAVGVIARSQTAAVLALGGALIGERILHGLVGDLTRFLPTSAMDALIENHGAALRPGVAAIALAVATAIVAAAAAALLRARDLS